MIKIDWDKNEITIGEVVIKTENLCERDGEGCTLVGRLERELKKSYIDHEVTPF